MTKYNPDILQTLLSATFCGALVVGSLSQPVQANSQPTGQGEGLPNPSLISLQFQPPGEAAPPSSMGGGTRGEVKFAPPGDAAPNNSMGGGTRGEVKFAPPGDGAPNNSMGGGTRGETRFSAPGEAAPQSSVGGGSRGDVSFSAPGEAAPASTASGGTRTDGLPAPTALLPTTRYGRTVAARPTFFVYMPPTAAREVFFSIQDQAGKHHYQTLLRISGTGGIISVTLPDNAPELEIGKNYVWFFAPIAPGGILRPDNNNVVGWVKRVEAPTVVGATALDRATEYAKSGIWYDTVTVLASAKQTQPGNATLTSEWKDLLKQVGLEAIATQPIAERL